MSRDIYSVANQLEGYVDTSTPDHLAQFLLREGREAAELANTIVRQRTLIADMMTAMMNRLDNHDPKVKALLLRALDEMPDSDMIPE